MLNMRTAFLASALALAGASIAATQAQTDAARELIGTWRLVSWTDVLSDGTTRLNPRSVGYLIYTDAKRMCAILMDPNRPKWKDPRVPSGSEAISAMNGLTAYCGTYEINATERSVVHHVDIEGRPNLIGIDRKRFFSFEGKNRVTLRLAQPETAAVVASTLIWERVEAPPIER